MDNMVNTVQTLKSFDEHLRALLLERESLMCENALLKLEVERLRAESLSNA